VNRLVAGIDGGQTSTIALIADERGRVLARGTAGPADEVGVDPTSQRLAEAVCAALDRARAAAGLPEATRFAATVAGISGFEGRIYGKEPQLATERLVLMHDAPIAHAGALAGEPGAIVVAGTGSVVYACNEKGESQTWGGWGYVFGDEGSAFRIAVEALALLMRAQDDDDRSHLAETQVAKGFFDLESLRAIARAVYAGEISRARLAAFAPLALGFGEAFRAIAERGADRLAALAARAMAFAAAPKVALIGGLFGDALLRAYLQRRIAELAPGAQVVEPRYEPAAGALLLAYRELGLAAPELSP
jgi:glucosamine kinase